MFKKSKRRTAGRRNFDDSSFSTTQLVSDKSLLKEYPQRITFYTLPPQEEITLDQFETYAIDRLKILIEVGTLQSQGLSYEDLVKLMNERIRQLMPLHSNNTIEDLLIYEERKKDYYSHFILRLAFCRSEELRRKFINSETFLFKLRYSQLNKGERNEFVKAIDLPWEEVGDEEKADIRQGICRTHHLDIVFGVREGTLNVDLTKFQRKQLNSDDVWEIMKTQKIGKLPWSYVPDLVSNRKVFLKKGYAYVPEFLQLNLIANEFQHHLEKELLTTNKYLIGMDEDDRLQPILENLSKGYINSDIQGFENNSEVSENGVTANNVGEFEKFFPACGVRLFNGLSDKHHLRFIGRNQLQLFLKGIGLGPQEALKFWQMMFTNGIGSITTEKFNKEYKYNLRHNYGLEGARINYKPWNCAQIISKPKPTSNEYHGCPYRDLHSENLNTLLRKMGLEDDGNLQRVLQLSENGDYQAACTKVFETVNAANIQENVQRGLQVQETPISHPNDYFNRALVYEKRLKEISGSS